MWTNYHYIFLCLACIAAVRVRVYNIERYGIYLDENAPYHHLRSAKVLSETGSLNNWYDTQSWHPIGVEKGGSVSSFPGLLHVASITHRISNIFSQLISNQTISMYYICVFLPIIGSVISTVLSYLIVKEISTTKNTSPQVAKVRGLVAAGFVAIVPGYVYRSVAGLYDYESVGIPAMLMCCYLWISACNSKCEFWYDSAGNTVAFSRSRTFVLYSCVQFAVSYGCLMSVWSTGSLFVGFTILLHVVFLFFGLTDKKDLSHLYQVVTFR